MTKEKREALRKSLERMVCMRLKCCETEDMEPPYRALPPIDTKVIELKVKRIIDFITSTPCLTLLAEEFEVRDKYANCEKPNCACGGDAVLRYQVIVPKPNKEGEM